MKWSVAVLVLVGLLAATAAAVLVSSLKAGGRMPAIPGIPQAQRPAEIEVLVATRDLQPMAVVDSSAVSRRKVPRERVPEGFMSEPVQVVGHVLALPATKDAAFTQAHFARKPAAALAAAVPQGRRGVTLALTADAAMVNLLYPGCMVDVLASFDVPTQESHQGSDRKETVSVTVLQGVQVLAVEGKTVLSDGDAKASSGGYNQKCLVTLQVAPKEAELLQLVRASKGEISLTMRNPMEGVSVQSTGSMSLRQLSELFGRRATEPLAVETPSETSTAGRPQWAVVVMHGNAVEKTTFEIPVSSKTIN